jgi:6-phosphogluconolactonase
MQNAENRQMPPNTGGPHPTQGFPAHQPPPPGDPRWLAAPPAPRRRRGPALLAIILGVLVALVGGFVVGMVVNDDEPVAGRPADDPSAQPAANEEVAAEEDSQPGGEGGDDGVGPGAAASGGGSGVDLRKGGVFVMSNDASGNEVVALARGEDGRLTEIGRYDTGGVGSGSFEDTSNAIVLGTAEGEASPQHNLDSANLLFVPNAGSNTIAVFRVDAEGLELVDVEPSNGEKPVGLTVNDGVLYALNSGELDDRLVADNDPVTLIDNCTHGELPTVTGFEVSPLGELTPIANSTRQLSGAQESGCAQVSFTPDGDQLIVTERVATIPGQTPDQGALVAFDVNEDGTLGAKHVTPSAGAGPFGFAFAPDGTLLVSENNLSEVGGSNTSSYTILEDGTMKPISKSVPDHGTDACWVVITNDGRYAFVSNAFGGGTVSTYAIEDTGALRLVHASATRVPGEDAENDNLTDGTTDPALSRDSRFYYQLNSISGLVQVFQVNDDGSLTFVEQHEVFAPAPPPEGGQLPPFGIAAY